MEVNTTVKFDKEKYNLTYKPKVYRIITMT